MARPLLRQEDYWRQETRVQGLQGCQPLSRKSYYATHVNDPSIYPKSYFSYHQNYQIKVAV